MIAAAARALEAGDAIEALKRVSLRDDPPALALRGIALAQLGELAEARALLRRARRLFGTHEPLSHARCVVAEAEVSLAMRDLRAPSSELSAAMATLESRADRVNAAHARLLAARRLLLLGRVQEAGALLDALDTRGMPAGLAAMAGLAIAESALRSLRVADARNALARAGDAARAAGIPAIQTEVEALREALNQPAARRLYSAQAPRLLSLEEVQRLLNQPDLLVIDGLRHGVRAGEAWITLARRPILFALVKTLATSWPADVDRQTLIEQVFRTRRPDETHRVRLRVELGRLRRLLQPRVRIEATSRGFRLVPASCREVAVLTPPVEGTAGALTALLSDGAAWSSSALAIALDTSQRTIQRALVELDTARLVRSEGQGRAQRWFARSVAEFATFLLLPASPPSA